MLTVLRGGHVVDPATGRDSVGDVWFVIVADADGADVEPEDQAEPSPAGWGDIDDNVGRRTVRLAADDVVLSHDLHSLRAASRAALSSAMTASEPP